jgi:hypothetical protein
MENWTRRWGIRTFYNIATDLRSAGHYAPRARDHTGGGVVDGRFCIADGRDCVSASFFYKPVAPTKRHDFAPGEWVDEADLSIPRAG